MALLHRLVREGFDLVPDADRLIIRPASALSAEQRECIRTHRDALVALVSFDYDDRRRCTSCAGYRGVLCPRPVQSGIAEPGATAALLQRCAGFRAR